MKKRILSTFLSLVLCLSLIPTAAFAEGAEGGNAAQPSDTDSNDYYTIGTPEDDVAAVQALIDALPTAETVTADDYDTVQDAYDAYDALSIEQQAQITGAEAFEALFAWFNGQTMPVKAVDEITYITADGTASTTAYAKLDSTSSGTQSEGTYYVSSGFTMNSDLSFTGNTTLVLGDGVTLTVKGVLSCTGDLTITTVENAKNATLTVNGGVKSDDNNGYGIYSGGSLSIYAGTVNATGGNVTADNSRSYGIFVSYGSLTISGSSTSVTAAGADITADNSNSYGIRVSYGALTISGSGAQVTAKGGKAENSYGIYTNGTTAVSGNTRLTAEGDKENKTQNSCGIYCVTINIGGNAQVTAEAGNVSNVSCGIDCETVTISDGAQVTAKAGIADTNYSAGIYANNSGNASVNINGGTVEATGSAGSGSYGIWVQSQSAISSGNVTITDGTVTATAGAAGACSYGIYANSNVTISGGTVTAISNTATATDENGFAYSYGICAGGSAAISSQVAGKDTKIYGKNSGPVSLSAYDLNYNGGTLTLATDSTFTYSLSGTGDFLSILPTGYAFALRPTEGYEPVETTPKEKTTTVGTFVLKLCDHMGGSNSARENGTCKFCGASCDGQHDYVTSWGGCSAGCTDDTVCKHENIDENGKCSACQTQFRAKLTAGSDTYWAMNVSALMEKRAAGAENTVTLYTDLFSMPAFTTTGAAWTLDLNGHDYNGQIYVGDSTTAGNLTVSNSGAVGWQYSVDGIRLVKGTAKLNVGVYLSLVEVPADSTLGVLLPANAAFETRASSGDTYTLFDTTRMKQISGELRVVAHTSHSYNSTTGKCGCGAECEHTNIGTNGKCTNCQYQFAVCGTKTTTSGDVTKYYKTVKDAVEDYCTSVKLLADCDEEVSYADGDCAFDLNGHTLTALIVNSNDHTVFPTIEDNSEAKTGTITTLTVNSHTTLKGGNFGTIKHINNTNKIPAPANGYAFQHTGENNSGTDFVKWSELGTTLSNVKVVACISHSYANGTCEYCGNVCYHSVDNEQDGTYDIDDTTGKCKVCQKQFELKDGNGKYYDNFSGSNLGNCTNGNNNILLCDVTKNIELDPKLSNLNLDLNGHALNGTITFGNSITSLEFTLRDTKGGGSLTALNDDNSSKMSVYGGHVGTLSVKYTSTKLYGGTYDKIEAKNGRTTLDILPDGYAYQSTAEGGGMIKRSELGTTLSNVKVVECTSHSYANGKCEYCGYVCSRENISDNGYCSDCHHQYAVKRTLNGETTWYDTIPNALDGLNNMVIVKLTLYQDVNAGTVSVSDLNLTLDLNSHTLTANITVTDGGLLLANGDVQTGGKLTGTVTNDGSGMFSTYGDVTISGHVTLAGYDSFEAGTKLQGGVKTVAVGKTLVNHLNSGAAFAKKDANGNYTVLINGNVTEITEPVKVVQCTHDKETDGKCDYCGSTLVAQNGSTNYTSFATACAAAQNGDTIKLLSNVTAAMTISDSNKKITLDLNGKTVSDLTISVPTTITDSVGGGTITALSTSGDVKIGGLLAAGYGFKDTNGKWYDSSSEATSVSNGSVKKLPITGVSILTNDSKTSFTYGEDVMLTANVTLTNGVTATPTYAWKKAGSNGQSIGTTQEITLEDLAPDEYKIQCTVMVDGYSLSNYIEFTVTKATPTGAPKYTAITTSGKKLADAALTANENWPTGTVQWVQDDGVTVLTDTTEVTANTAYKWLFTPTDTTNYNAINGSITLWHRSSGGSSGGSSSSSTSTTTKNPDGSTTTTTTDKKTGEVTETTKDTNGVTGTTVTDKDGNVTDISANIPASATKDGETVMLPIDEVKTENETTIDVEVPDGGATIKVPVKDPTPGTVIVIVDKDGTETVIPGSKVTENGIEVKLTEDATIKVIDNSKSFDDVKPGDYFSKPVQWASARDITGGTSATTFGPHDSCTRAQLVTFLYRYAQSQNSGFTGAWMFQLPFSDVPEWCYESVAWCYMNNIVGGYGNGLFGSNDTITREQMAVILYRFAQLTGMDTTQGGMAVREYSDYESISDYAVTAMQWAVNAGILQGYNNHLMPVQPCTRAQIVTMLYRLLGT